MPRLLHVVRRPDAAVPDPVAEQLIECATPHNEVRVLELFDAPAGAQIVDLTLAERHVAEVAAALHWADEVHSHGVHPRLVLDNLPLCRPEVLQETALVLHGPWPAPVRDVGRRSARLQSWPGRVLRDALADPEACPEGTTVVPFRPGIDRNDPRLLPRVVGPKPMRLEDGSALAVIGLSAEIGDARRDDLRHALSTVSRPELQVEVVDETDVPKSERAEARRAFQAFVVPEIEPPHWRASTLEALAQGLPIVALGAATKGAPPGVIFASGEAAVDRAVSCIRSWAAQWAEGRPAPVDIERGPWFDNYLARARPSRT